MIKDFYSREAADNNYDSNRLEIGDPLSQLIIKIENTLFTRKNEVMGVPEFGSNLEDLIFSLVLNESVIEEKISQQITAFCSLNDKKFLIETKVKFYSTSERKGAFVDIYINERRVLGALF